MEDIKEEEVAKKVDEAVNNAKCSFCGNDTSCEQCGKEAVPGFEHMCYDCYQKMGGVPENLKEKTHVCVPPEKMRENFERFMNEMTMRAFNELWNAEKKKLKEMSKQELSQASFFEGARFMFHFINRMSEKPPEQPDSGSPPPAGESREKTG
ncbi:MAG: hypothetical protein AB1324_04005 [Candidatus Micrarchaeota archaeon]